MVYDMRGEEDLELDIVTTTKVFLVEEVLLDKDDEER